MKMKFIMLAVLFTVTALKCSAEISPAELLAAGIQKQLPAGWTCTLISEKGKMGHPHGLSEPLFRLDFINTNLTFQAKIGKEQSKSVHPNLRLHFHGIAARDDVRKTIKAEENYPWAIPVLFAEMRDYLVITTPLWQNNFTEQVGGKTWGAGDYSDEANKAIAPLLQALKAYFDAKK